MRAYMDRAHQEAERVENMLVHEAEISARPARTWYQTETQKKDARELSRLAVKQEQKAAAVAIKVPVALSAQEKAAMLARRDDYRTADGATKDKTKGPKDKDGHRLSRKKRRRMEAFEELEEEAKGNGRGAHCLIV
jgi:ATP-dependent RNA helicase DDX27